MPKKLKRAIKLAKKAKRDKPRSTTAILKPPKTAKPKAEDLIPAEQRRRKKFTKLGKRVKKMIGGK